jgi:hypothetical protein
MMYPEFVKLLMDKHGEQQGLLMALRAEVGFLRKYLEQMDGEKFNLAQEEMIADFLARHP